MKKLVVVLLVAAMLLQPVFSLAEPGSAGESPEPTPEVVTAEPTPEFVTPEPTLEPTEEVSDNQNYLELAQAIPLADGSCELPDGIETQLLNTAYILETDIPLSINELIISSVADMELSSQEKEQICLKFSEECDISIISEQITLQYDYVQLDYTIDLIKYSFKVFNDGYIMKEVSMMYEGVEYIVRNGNNELLVKIDGSEPHETVKILSEEELDEFTADLIQGLVPPMDTYTIDFVRAYLTSKSAEPGMQGLATIQSTSDGPYVYLSSLSDAGFIECTAQYVGSRYGYCNGLNQYTKDNSNNLKVDIYDTRTYVPVTESSYAFKAMETIGNIANGLNLPDTLVETVLTAMGLIVGTDKWINGPVNAVYAATCNGFYTREGSFYESTFVLGEVEAYEVYGDCLITYAGTDLNEQGLYQRYTWTGSIVEFVGHGTINSELQSYADLVAGKYCAELGVCGGHWPFGSNRDGGLLDGTQFAEHSCSFSTGYNVVDEQEHIRICDNGVCQDVDPHEYSHQCDNVCDKCYYVDHSRDHIFPWTSNGAVGEIAYCTKCGLENIRPHGNFTVETLVNGPTCTTGGKKLYNCDTCEYFYIETYQSLGHDLRSGSCDYKYCVRAGCAYTSGTTAHAMGSWFTVTSATCTRAGTKQRSCTKCTYSETGTISALGHSYGSWSNYSVNQHRRKCIRCSVYQYGSHYGTGNNCSACGRPRPWSTTE